MPNWNLKIELPSNPPTYHGFLIALKLNNNKTGALGSRCYV